MRKILSIIPILMSLFVSAQSCLTDWAYHQNISIVNNNSSSLTDYQLKITVNTASLISNGKMLANGADLRFSLASSCCSIVPHYVESGLNTSTTIIWVKISSIPTGTSGIRMFYGNGGATDISSASSVFDLWEDFNSPGSQLVTKCGSGTITQGAGQANYSWNSNAIWESSTSFPLSNIYTAEMKVVAATGNWPGLYWKKSTGHSYSMLMGGGQVRVAKTSSASAFPADCAGHNWASTPVNYTSPAGIWSLTWINTGSVEGSFPGVGSIVANDAENAKNTPLKIGIGGITAAAGTMSLDWLRVRKWASIEPFASAFAPEQTNPAIPLAILISNNGFCSGQSTTITASGAPSYTWNTGDNTNSISVTPSVTSSYTVRAANLLGCEKSAITTITVHPNPVLSVIGSTVACSGQPATLTASGANTYTWSSGETVPTITANVSGPVTYTVYGESAAGCPGSVIQSISLSSTPTLAVNGFGDICAGNSLTITASGASTYSWINTGSSLASIVVSPSVSTVYTVTGYSADGECSATSVHSVNVTTALLSASSDTTCVDGPNITLNGLPTGGVYAGPNLMGNVFVAPAVNGVYAVSYLVTNTLVNCVSSATVAITVDLCAGIGDVLKQGHEFIKMYPNPATSIVTIDFKTIGQKQIDIVDALGRIVLSVNTTEQIINLDLIALSQGVYTVKTESQGTTSIGRLIKNNQ